MMRPGLGALGARASVRTVADDDFHRSTIPPPVCPPTLGTSSLLPLVTAMGSNVALARDAQHVQAELMDEKFRRKQLAYYMLASAIIWASIIAGMAVILQGTPYFAQVLPILTAGVVTSVGILPYSLRYIRQ